MDCNRTLSIVVFVVALGVVPQTATGEQPGAESSGVELPAERLDFEDARRNAVSLLDVAHKTLESAGFQAESYNDDARPVGDESVFEGKLTREQVEIELEPASMPAITGVIRKLEARDPNVWISRIKLTETDDGSDLFETEVTLATLKFEGSGRPKFRDDSDEADDPMARLPFPERLATDIFLAVRGRLARTGRTLQLDVDLDRELLQLNGMVESATDFEKLESFLDERNWTEDLSHKPVKVYGPRQYEFQLQVMIN